MHTKVRITKVRPVEVLTPDGKIDCIRTIDQYPCIRGNVGLSGFPASDVSLFNKLSSNVASQQKFAALMQHISMLKAEKNRNKDLTVRQMIERCMPAYIQKPAERVRFYEWLDSQGFYEPEATPTPEEKLEEKPVEPVAPQSD